MLEQPKLKNNGSNAARSPRGAYSEPGRTGLFAALCSWSEHVLNELPVTLRYASIFHEVSSSNRLAVVLQHWLTLLSLSPDTHETWPPRPDTANAHTHTPARTRRLGLIMEIRLLTKGLSVRMLRRFLLFQFNKPVLVWLSRQRQQLKLLISNSYV